jgi:hypothetical protein
MLILILLNKVWKWHKIIIYNYKVVLKIKYFYNIFAKLIYIIFF